jgi:hypothetical protein
MDQTFEYQGYTIQSTPQYQTDRDTWRAHIVISVEDFRSVRAREYSSDVLFSTEQEAHVQGMAYGERVIDGMVEGRTVTDIKWADRRTTPRLRVHFRTTISASPTLEGTGILRDLSSGGCRVESPVIVEPGLSLELPIVVPELQWPLRIEAARVQWVTGQTIGLTFYRISVAERQRLGQVINTLMEG